MQLDKNSIVRAKDVASNGVVTLDGMATASDAAAMMREKQTQYILVEKRHDDDAWGIIVVRDFIKGVLVAERSPHEVNLYEIMTKPVITVPADMDIRYVARLLFRADIRRAPVEENGELIGMISLSSLILENGLF